MSKSKNEDSYQHQVYKILDDLYRNEKFFKDYLEGQEFQGYLIEKRQIDKIKKDIEYDKIKPLIEKNESYENIKVKIKENNVKIKEIIPKKFNSSSELITELNNKSFIIIKQERIGYLCNSNKSKGQEMKFKFENNSINIIFSENDKFKINNIQGIIEKNNYEQSNSNSFTSSETPTNNIRFKKDLEILIRIFYFNKYLKEKDNTSFGGLNGEKTGETNKTGEVVYLINNSWMEEYKSFYEYKDFENYLINKNEYPSGEAINKFINDLPIDYISKINKKNNFDKNKAHKYDQNKHNGKINYFYNNNIINAKIYDLFKESGYKIADSLIQLDLYFI